MPPGPDLSQFGDPAAGQMPDLSGFGTPMGHPVAGPSGSFWTDAARRLGAAAIDAGTAVISPLMGRKNVIGIGIQDGVPRIVRGTPSLEQARDEAFRTLGATEYQPQTTAGRLGQAALTGALGGVISPSSIPAMAAGSATGELAAELAPSHPTVARFLGFLPGALLARGASNLPLKPAGGTVNAPTAELAQAATQNYGIPLAAGQLSGNPFVRYFYSETGKMPFSGAEAFSGTQQGAFNRAVAQTFGETADRITPEVLQGAKARIGAVFNDVAAKTKITADPQFGRELMDVVKNAPLVLTDAEWGPIQRQLGNVLGKVDGNNTISGEAYQALTRKGTPLDLAINSSNPNLRFWSGQIRTALDDALQRSASPEDLASLTQARAQWKAMRTVEPLTLRADAVQGAKPSSGDVSPAALRAAVNQSYGNAAFAPLGQLPLNDLAKIGQRFLKEPPDSGTATRTAVQHGLAGTGALATALTAHELGLPLAASAAGTVGGLAAARAAQSVMRNQLLARRMINAGLNPEGFAFTYPSFAQQAPFLLAPPGATALPATSANLGQR